MSSPTTSPIEFPLPVAFDEATIETVRTARRRLERDARDADALLVVAIWYSMLGEAATSLRFLHRLTAIHPEYPGVWRLKAGVYRQLGNEEMASRCEGAALRYEGRDDDIVAGG